MMMIWFKYITELSVMDSILIFCMILGYKDSRIQFVTLYLCVNIYIDNMLSGDRMFNLQIDYTNFSSAAHFDIYYLHKIMVPWLTWIVILTSRSVVQTFC